jgi:hypothetical protein
VVLLAKMALRCSAPARPDPPTTGCWPHSATGGGDEENARRFRPDKGFQGVDYSAAAQAAVDGQPVQFERDAPEADPFGLDQFLTDVRRSSTVCRSRALVVWTSASESSCAAGVWKAQQASSLFCAAD